MIQALTTIGLPTIACHTVMCYQEVIVSAPEHQPIASDELAQNLYEEFVKEDGDEDASQFEIPGSILPAFRAKMTLYREAVILMVLILQSKKDRVFQGVLSAYEEIIFGPAPTVAALEHLEAVKRAMGDLDKLFRAQTELTWSSDWLKDIGHTDHNPARTLQFAVFWMTQYRTITEAAASFRKGTAPTTEHHPLGCLCDECLKIFDDSPVDSQETREAVPRSPEPNWSKNHLANVAFANYVIRPFSLVLLLGGILPLLRADWLLAGALIFACFVLGITSRSLRHDNASFRDAAPKMMLACWLFLGIVAMRGPWRWYYAIPISWLVSFLVVQVPYTAISFFVRLRPSRKLRSP